MAKAALKGSDVDEHRYMYIHVCKVIGIGNLV